MGCSSQNGIGAKIRLKLREMLCWPATYGKCSCSQILCYGAEDYRCSPFENCFVGRMWWSLFSYFIVHRNVYWSLVKEDPLDEGMATISNTLARRIPWTEEAGGLQSIWLKEQDMTEATLHARMWKCLCFLNSLSVLLFHDSCWSPHDQQMGVRTAGFSLQWGALELTLHKSLELVLTDTFSRCGGKQVWVFYFYLKNFNE